MRRHVPTKRHDVTTSEMPTLALAGHAAVLVQTERRSLLGQTISLVKATNSAVVVAVIGTNKKYIATAQCLSLDSIEL